jgi:8-oxo-dGTP diphosphatase
MGTTRRTRYQAAILRDDEILLIRHSEHADGHTYWLLPGGGIEAGESEIACVQREVREETNLEVEVEGLLLDDLLQYIEDGPYKRYKTYLCRPITGEASPGYEPESSAAAVYAIVEVKWFSLFDETTWDELILNDAITLSGLRRIRAAAH